MMYDVPMWTRIVAADAVDVAGAADVFNAVGSAGVTGIGATGMSGRELTRDRRLMGE
jgi:hypothetical protein